ncbi:hypothetical protein GS451_20690 [Rhodococcus hoagii]|nr:hypothetical protein [Prescottella equi]
MIAEPGTARPDGALPVTLPFGASDLVLTGFTANPAAFSAAAASSSASGEA